YALYGQTSGGRRDGSMMRSQYADLGTKTYVELEFEVRGKRYHVLRNPEYERESKRKNKDGERTTTKEKAGVELYLADGTMYGGTRQEINRKLVEILGVDARQFTQIAMIAQGDFMKLLLAKSDERKEIFSRIFDTRVFWRVQEILKNQAKSLYIQLEDNRKSCLREIEQLEGTKAEDESLKKNFLESGQREPDLDGVLTFVTDILEEDQKIYKKSQENEKKCSRELEKKSQEYSLGKERMIQFQELDKVQMNWEQLEEKKEFWEEKTRKLQWAKKSIPVAAQEEAYKKAEGNLEITQKRLETLDKWFAEHGQETKEKSIQLDKIKSYQQKLQKEELPALQKLSQSLEKYEKLQRSMEEASILKGKLETEKNRYQAAEKTYQLYAVEYEEIYQSYFKEQAGILASELTEGKPCPVCGSITHPKLAPLSQDAPTKEQVERKKTKRAKAEKERESTQRTLLDISSKFETKMAVIRETQQELLGKESGETSLEEIKTRWDTWEQKARERLKKGNELVRTTELKLEECMADHQKAVRVESIRKGQLEENQELEKNQRKLLDIEKQKYFAALQAQGFETEEMYRSCKMDDVMRENQEEQLAEYQHARLETAQQKKLLEAQLEGKKRPELTELETLISDMREKQRLMEKEIRRIYSRREKNRSAMRKLMALEKERAELRARYEKIGNISRTANGNLSGSVKIDFESYMQRQYFEQMINCANHHLQKMAAGQFLLRCRSLEHLSTQGSAGLDLDVYSLVTGKERDVKTLSGGESFMASLALALGMTDVITRTCGAVRIETLFIDEGFGSLDENSREQAIRILQGLSGGQRLVGIISHVTELKEQIEQKLVVTKNKQGSQAVWN
ncbi:MAG: SMC family ATPase, partial [Clostridia bacterium]|nr:SMC family ATPase [Clostridia bacterium]